MQGPTHLMPVLTLCPCGDSDGDDKTVERHIDHTFQCILYLRCNESGQHLTESHH